MISMQDMNGCLSYRYVFRLEVLFQSFDILYVVRTRTRRYGDDTTQYADTWANSESILEIGVVSETWTAHMHLTLHDSIVEVPMLPNVS